MMKTIAKLHLWLSIPFGVIIAIVCFTGSMLVFEKEISHALQPELYYAEPTGHAPLSADSLLAVARAAVPDSVQITGLTVYPDPKLAYKFGLSHPHKGALYVNQYTGQVNGQWKRPGFFDVSFRMHRWLMDSVKPGGGTSVGRVVVGVSVIAFALALATGTALWVPRVRRSAAKNLRISVRHGWHRFWKSLHVAGGIYALVFLLAMSLTGLTWSFQWYSKAFYAVCGVEYKAKDKKRGAKPEADSPATTHWETALQKLRALNPEAKGITVSNGTARVSVPSGNIMAADTYSVDAQNGDIHLKTRYAQQPEADRLRGWIYSVHTGEFGGMATRLLWFAASLFATSLPLTGYYFWIRRLYRSHK